MFSLIKDTFKFYTSTLRKISLKSNFIFIYIFISLSVLNVFLSYIQRKINKA